MTMAYMTAPAQERRHIPDRRMIQSGAAERSGSATESASRDRFLDKDESESRMNALDWIGMTLLIIGGLNWGIVGLFGINLVEQIFGDMGTVARAIYILVGLSALYSIYTGSKMGRNRD
jgi:uncharacterized membrane protein YuzA (DUF378 family)